MKLVNPIHNDKVKNRLDNYDVLAIVSLGFLVAAISVMAIGGLASPISGAEISTQIINSVERAKPAARAEPIKMAASALATPPDIDRKELATLPDVLKQPIIFTLDEEEGEEDQAEPETEHRPLRLAKSIDKNKPFIAPNQQVAFALPEDFTGRPLFDSTLIAPTDTQHLDQAAVKENIWILKSGESFSDLLARANVVPEQAEIAIAALGTQTRLRALKPGAIFELTFQEKNLTPFQLAARNGKTEQVLTGVDYRADKLTTIRLTRRGSDFHAVKITAPMEKRYIALSGVIKDNLFWSAKKAGMPTEATAKLANLFLYDIDFQREIFAGDQFEAVYEAFYNDRGEMVKVGDIVYGRLSWRGGKKTRGYYLYTDKNGKTDWFDAKGESARRFLMKTVIEGARITSRFGRRRHPISGYTKAHKGVDFGARRGTPVMAAGDGIIERANRFSTYGNYVKIKHANGYETAYAHLNGFAKGIKKGQRVRQGQIIAYVGSTGRSTGPHLHYEVLRRGKQINPLTLKVADGKKLKGDALRDFTEERDWINRLRTEEARLQLASLRP